MRGFTRVHGSDSRPKPWSMKGVEGVYRFLAAAWRLIAGAEAEDPPARRG